MSRGFKVPINLVGLATDPATANNGDIYFNTASSTIRFYTSTGWQNVGSGTGGGTLNHTHDYNGNPIVGVGELVGTSSFGAGVPNNNTGSEGDLYIDITNMNIYLKGVSAWGSPTEINVYTKEEITSLLSGKQDKITGVSDTEIGYLDGVTSSIQTQLNSKAPILSPTFTGVPLAPTATSGTNTTQIATTAFVAAAIGGFQNTVDINYVSWADVGNVDGVASLDATGNVPYSQLGNIGNAFATVEALSDVEALALAGL